LVLKELFKTKFDFFDEVNNNANNMNISTFKAKNIAFLLFD